MSNRRRKFQLYWGSKPLHFRGGSSELSILLAILSFILIALGNSGAFRPAPRRLLPADSWFADCDDMRSAGVAPLYAGEPGYRPEMDGDGDGIACEPYRGRR